MRLPYLQLPPAELPRPVTASPGATTVLIPKLVVNHSEQLGPINQGFVQVEVARRGGGEPTGDTLVLSLKEGGFQIKDGSTIWLKAALITTVAVNTNSCIRLEFGAQCKATQKHVAMLLRNIGLRVPPDADGAERVVKFTGSPETDKVRLGEVGVVVRPSVRSPRATDGH